MQRKIFKCTYNKNEKVTHSGFGICAFKSSFVQISSQSGKHRSFIRDTCPTKLGHFSVMKSRNGYKISFDK